MLKVMSKAQRSMLWRPTKKRNELEGLPIVSFVNYFTAASLVAARLVSANVEEGVIVVVIDFIILMLALTLSKSSL